MSPLLWKPESWPSRLEELEARTGDLKEAPLRRDVRSLGMLLGEVLREQAGERLFRLEEDLRQLSIERREAASKGDARRAAHLLKQQMVRVAKLDLPDAYQLTRAFAYYFELINLAETNHRKRRRTSMQMSTEGGAPAIAAAARGMPCSAARSGAHCAPCGRPASMPTRHSRSWSACTLLPSLPRTRRRWRGARCSTNGGGWARCWRNWTAFRCPMASWNGCSPRSRRRSRRCGKPMKYGRGGRW